MSRSSVAPMAGSVSASFKLFLLVWFVLQSTTQTLLGAYNRSAVPKDELYDINAMLFLTECLKFVFSCVLEAYTMHREKQLSSVLSSPANLRTCLAQSCSDGWKMAVPAVLYWIGNTMAYVALSNLSAPVFQVLLQMKLLITAFLSVCLLQRKYVLRQWTCLLALAIGVASVALGETSMGFQATLLSVLGRSPSVTVGFDPALLDSPRAEIDLTIRLAADNAPTAAPTLASQTSAAEKSILVGILAIVATGFSGSMAGVFFEFVLKRKPVSQTTGNTTDTQTNRQPQRTTKRSNSKDDDDYLPVPDDEEAVTEQNATRSSSNDSNEKDGNGDDRKPPSVWLRNIQLSFFSIIAAGIRIIQSSRSESSSFSRDDFFHGFTPLVWTQIVLLAVGGLVVASVIKYADNVMKGLATGVSVVLATAFSIIFMGTKLTNGFLFGAVLIIGAVYFFSNSLPKDIGKKETIILISIIGTILYLSNQMNVTHETIG